MSSKPAHIERESHETTHRHGERSLIAGVEVREEDLEPQTGLHVATIVFRICAVVILLLALFQFTMWWMDRPPGGAGIGLLVGDTIRLIVFAGLLWAAGDLATLLVRTHYDIRAGRILLARQTSIMRMDAIVRGTMPPDIEADSDRRGHPLEELVVRGPHAPGAPRRPGSES